MCKNAELINDLRTEVVREIYMTCKIARIRIAKIVEVRSFANKLDDLESLLEVIDFIDKKLDAFRAKYKKLKQKEEQRVKAAKAKPKEPIIEQKSEEESDGEESEAENEGEEKEVAIGNIDLLELGLEDAHPGPVKQEKSKKEEKTKGKDKKLKKKKKSESEDEADEDDNSSRKDENHAENKGVIKIIAPPSAARKLKNEAIQNSKNQEQDPPKPLIEDLLDF